MIASGNVGLSSRRKGFWIAYDRGELLYLIAQNCIVNDACLEEARVTYSLSEREVSDIRSMID